MDLRSGGPDIGADLVSLIPPHAAQHSFSVLVLRKPRMCFCITESASYLPKSLCTYIEKELRFVGRHASAVERLPGASDW